MNYRCALCDYTSTKAHNVKRHTSMVHDLQESAKKSECTTAGKNVAEMGNFVTQTDKNVAPMGKIVAPPNTGTRKRHACEKCGKTFGKRVLLVSHLEKCEGVDMMKQCASCGKVYANRFDKYRHKNKCLSPSVLPSIQIFSFNTENTSHVTPEFARKCFDGGPHGLKPMIDAIYFNKEHPENHNIQLESMKNAIVRVKTDDGWTSESMLMALDRMISNATSIILHKIGQLSRDIEGDLPKMAELQNLSREIKKKLREHCKGKLVDRRRLFLEAQ